MAKKVDTNPIAKYTGRARTAAYHPFIFDLSRESDRKKIAKLLKTDEVRHINDTYKEQLRELFAITHPPLAFSPDFEKEFKAHYASLTAKQPEWRQGRWVFYPWLSTLVHILEEEDFLRVRTSRNRELITEEQQKRFYNSSIGVAGLSVGSAVALSIVLQGGARHIKLADFDTLDLSNTNRIRTGLNELGEPKTRLTARQIYLMNPYARVEILSHGITKESVSKFAKDLSIIVDELDNLAAKLMLRKEARARRIPVIMAADCADNAVVDIERYDLDGSIIPFHGRLGDDINNDLSGLNKKDTGRLIARLVGLENHNEAMLRSLRGLGSDLVSWPQLGSTAQLNAAVLTYCARRILTNEPVTNTRGVVSLDQIFDPTFADPAGQEKRERAITEFARIFDI